MQRPMAITDEFALHLTDLEKIRPLLEQYRSEALEELYLTTDAERTWRLRGEIDCLTKLLDAPQRLRARVAGKEEDDEETTGNSRGRTGARYVPYR